MEYVHLISTTEIDKVRKIDKKSESVKGNLNAKTHQHKLLPNNKLHVDK